MFSVIINWLYITITVYFIGFAVLSLLSKKISVKPAFWNSLITGVITTSIYAQFFSLFYKVGLLANILLIIITLCCIFYTRRTILRPFQIFYQSIPALIKIIGGLLILVCASYILLLTVGVPKFIDTYLYHAQTIRWIEEYGCIKGIANLHDRLGFNSSFHAFSALYSMKWLFQQSLHATNGWNLIFLQTFTLWKTYRGIKERSFIVTTLSISAFMYSFFACGYSSSMGADIPAAAFVFILLILWCEALETNPNNTDTYALLSVFAVYIITVKFSCALFSLLFLYPAYLLVKEKKIKKIILYIFLGLLVAAPFFIRTVLVTGWLIFPFSALDLFSFDWKVPKQIVDYESELITMYARLPSDMAWIYQHKTFSEWIPRWLADQKSADLAIFLINLLFIIIESVHLIVKLIKKQPLSFEWVVTKSVIIICFLYWFFCAPAVRFGWSCLLFFPAVTLESLLKNSRNSFKYVPHISFFLIFCIMIYIATEHFDTRNSDISEALSQRPYIMQIDYENIENVGTFSLGNITLFYPKEEGKTGYHAFPAAIADYSEGGPTLRGSTIEYGFHFQ